MSGEAHDPRPAIARNLRRLMKSRDISLAQLCERTEIPQGRIERVLAADSELTARDVLRLAGAVDARVSELLDRSRDG